MCWLWRPITSFWQRARAVGDHHWLSDDWAASGLIPSLREMAAALQERTDVTEGRAVIVDQDHSEMTYAFAQRLGVAIHGGLDRHGQRADRS